MLFRTSVILFVFIVLSGCENRYFSSNNQLINDETVKNYNAKQIKIFSEKKTVKVERGDTVYSIAKRNGISIRDLILRNGLVAPYKILARGKGVNITRSVVSSTSLALISSDLSSAEF